MTVAPASVRARRPHAPRASPRRPLKAVKVLLPVWGRRYLRQCLEFSLPTLLAPGNVPALANTLPCEFVLMTRDEDVSLIQEHSAWRRLAEICDVEIRPIDDLIVDGNHHVTITLAYAQAVRAAGETMCDTCFVFLVSDCLMADGSLAHVLSRVQAGASGVVAGHLQMVAEDAMASLRPHFNPSGPELVLAPRTLMRVALAHLHPTTTGSMVDRGDEHYTNANRLFWRGDPDTLVARFYLMHMVGIRPETADFKVGASCDYSFIPEMCPSGDVAVITDSDDYLGVEMQPRAHEAGHLSPGPLNVPDFARGLSNWTTAQHRENARHPLIFHAEDISAAVSRVEAHADAFVESVAGHLPRKPQPHRHHPYWIGAMAAHEALGGRPPGRPAGQDGGEATARLREVLLRVLWRLRFSVFGRPPDVRVWHPRWPDFRLPFKAAHALSAGSDPLLIVSSAPGIFGHWLRHVACETVSLESARLQDQEDGLTPALAGGFGFGLLILLREQLDSAGAWIGRVTASLKPGGLLFVVVTDDIGDAVRGLDLETFRDTKRLLNAELRIREIRYVPESRLRHAVQQAMLRLATVVRQRPSLVFPLAAAGALLAVASAACNWVAVFRAAAAPPRHSSCSSVFIAMQVSEQASRPSRLANRIQVPA